MKRGQITAEFVIIMALATLIFLVIINFISQEQKSSAQGIWAQDAQNNAQKLADGINRVYIAGSGASMNVTLPKNLAGGINYTVTVRRRLVSLAVPAYGAEFERKFATARIDGAASGLGLSPGTLRIVNRNGTINLTTY